jgi:quinol monooxygenase YgiN
MLLLAAAVLGVADDPIVAQIRPKLADPGKPFVLAVTITLKPGKAEAFAAAVKPAVAASRKERGCLAYDFTLNADDPTEVFIYERWADLGALAAHLATPHFKALGPAVADLTTGMRLVVRTPIGD